MHAQLHSGPAAEARCCQSVGDSELKIRDRLQRPVLTAFATAVMRRRVGIQGLQRGAQARVSTQHHTQRRVKCCCRPDNPPIRQCEFCNRLCKRASSRCHAMQDHYKSLGEHVQAVKLEHMKSQLAVLKSSLEQFAIKHRCAPARVMHSSVCCECSTASTGRQVLHQGQESNPDPLRASSATPQTPFR